MDLYIGMAMVAAAIVGFILIVCPPWPRYAPSASPQTPPLSADGKKTAETLQAEGAEARGRGEYVSIIHPGMVPMYVDHQIPHLVLGHVPQEKRR